MGDHLQVPRNLVPIPVRWHRHVRRWLQDPWTYSDVHLQASI
jgi:hypothetical protein